MTLPAYRCPDLPRNGAEAFLPPPPPVVTPALVSSYGLVHVAGAPGTVALASPNPSTTNNVHPSADPRTQPGNVPPDGFPGVPGTHPWQTWAPDIYVALPDNMGPQRGALGIRVLHSEDLPVPAVKLQSVALSVQRTPPRTYGRVTPWPRVFPRFRSVLDPPTGA